MQLTEVRVNLCGGGNHVGRLKAFCSLTFDDTFVVRDVKLIEGDDGLFLAMPSRKLADHCPGCWITRSNGFSSPTERPFYPGRGNGWRRY